MPRSEVRPHDGEQIQLCFLLEIRGRVFPILSQEGSPLSNNSQACGARQKPLTFSRAFGYTYHKAAIYRGSAMHLDKCIPVEILLSSREVEGNGPVKPGNPPATLRGRCQFRRVIPRDEGNLRCSQTPEMQGFFVTLCDVYFSSQVNIVPEDFFCHFPGRDIPLWMSWRNFLSFLLWKGGNGGTF